MSRFTQIQDTSGNPELEALYREAIAMGLGRPNDGVPINFVTSQSERPDILAATLRVLEGIVLNGQLPPTVKQMIAMTIAMQNNCRYCTSLHTSALEAMGVPQEVIRSCAGDPDMEEVPPPQRAILKFALKTAREPLEVTDEDIEALREQGLSDGELIEVAMMASCENFLNTWARVSQIPIDGEENGTAA